MARWGMPTPTAFCTGRIDRGVANICNTASPHWRAWLMPQLRCLVPAISFCEPTDAADPVTDKKVWTWFALSEDRALFAFAGIWCTWRGNRGTQKNPVSSHVSHCVSAHRSSRRRRSAESGRPPDRRSVTLGRLAGDCHRLRDRSKKLDGVPLRPCRGAGRFCRLVPSRPRQSRHYLQLE